MPFTDNFVDIFKNTIAMLTIDTLWQVCLYCMRRLLLTKKENNRPESIRGENDEDT